MPIIKKDKDDLKSKMEICGQKKIKEAVNALKLLNKKFVEEDMKKQPLLEDTTDSYIYLQLSLKKIPPPQLIRMIRVTLPHSLVTETTEVCLITGDLEKHNHKAEIEPTVLHYKDLLRKQGVTKVSQVIPLRQLRTEYKTFESKRQLSAAYDVFLVDKKIAGVMAKTLGKTFFRSRKFPIQIDMRRPNLKEQIDKALCQTEFSLTCRGNSYAFEVARLSMEDKAIVENIKNCIDIFEDKLPGKKDNILSLYLKTAKSKAIPIYVSLDIPDDMLIKKPRKNDKYKLDELSTMDNTEVKVFRDGRVIVRKMKESSSLEDANENEQKIKDGDLVESEENILESISNKDSLKRKKKKKKVSHVNEIENEDIQHFEKASRKKNKKSADLVEDTNNTIRSEEETQECNSNKGSLKRKRKSKLPDAIEVINSEVENGEDIPASAKKIKKSKKCADLLEDITDTRRENDLTANEVSAKKKKSKKYANLDETNDNIEIEKDEMQNSFTADISLKKKKKSKKSVNVDEIIDIIENEEIQDSVTADFSMKKKKKGRKSILEQVSEMSSEEKTQNSSFIQTSSKKKNKKNNKTCEL